MKIYIKSNQKINAATQNDRDYQVIYAAVDEYFDRASIQISDDMMKGIKYALLAWKKLAKFWVHHGNGEKFQHHPENIVIITPDAHRMIHNLEDQIKIAKSSGEFQGYFTLNQLITIPNIILEYVLKQPIAQEKLLSTILSDVIVPILPALRTLTDSKQVKSAVLTELQNSNIEPLTANELNTLINSGFNTDAPISTDRIDIETESELLSIINGLIVDYKSDKTKQPMHRRSLYILRDFIENNEVTREELYNEFVLNQWNKSKENTQ